MRLSSARCVLVAARFDRLVPFDVQTKLSLVMQDSRQGRPQGLRWRSWGLGVALPAPEAAAVPPCGQARGLARPCRRGPKPREPSAPPPGRLSVTWCTRRKNLRRLGERDRRSGLVVMRPEFSLVYVIHALAHHSDYPTASEAEEFGVNESYAPFQQMILFYLDALSREGNYRDDRKGKAKLRGRAAATSYSRPTPRWWRRYARRWASATTPEAGPRGERGSSRSSAGSWPPSSGWEAPPLLLLPRMGRMGRPLRPRPPPTAPSPTADKLVLASCSRGGGLGGLKPVLPAGLDLASTGVTENFSAKKKGIKLEGGGGGKKKAKSPKRKSPDSTPSPGNRRRRRRRRTTPEGKKGAVLSPAAANVKRERPGRAAKSKAAAAIAADGGRGERRGQL